MRESDLTVGWLNVWGLRSKALLVHDLTIHIKWVSWHSETFHKNIKDDSLRKASPLPPPFPCHRSCLTFTDLQRHRCSLQLLWFKCQSKQTFESLCLRISSKNGSWLLLTIYQSASAYPTRQVLWRDLNYTQKTHQTWLSTHRGWGLQPIRGRPHWHPSITVPRVLVCLEHETACLRRNASSWRYSCAEAYHCGRK